MKLTCNLEFGIFQPNPYQATLNAMNTPLVNFRSDSGKYTLKAHNENGSDTGSCQVTVIDKPSAPEGPLEVSDVQAHQVTLDWKPPGILTLLLLEIPL